MTTRQEALTHDEDTILRASLLLLERGREDLARRIILWEREDENAKRLARALIEYIDAN